ncbi:MAG: class II D-tagatose-bisphosphate aldolase non-catalytic subunit, partial [Thermoplasmatota archaeon]
MKVFDNVSELDAHARAALSIAHDAVAVKDEPALASEWMDALAATAVFAPAEVRDRARWIVRAAAHAVGVKTASIHAMYVARAKKLWNREMTVPAMNLRGPTYDVARAAFRAANARAVGALVFEIARSEIGYTEQRPAEYAAVVTAAALREGFRGPLFLQGDHYQFSPSKYPQSPDAEKKAIRALIDESLAAGFRNIDIDASTLVTLAPSSVREQQNLNAKLSAEM